MSELIDRKRFSADMRDFQNRVGIWRDEAEDTETRTRADAALATIIETKLILDKQPTIPASPWHRVEDGLPKSGEFGEIVLACNDVGTVNAAYLSSNGKWYAANNTMYDAWTWMSNVTHWMPMPEPPKEDA